MTNATALRFLAIMAASIAAASAWGQSATGTIVGTVRDPASLAMPGVSITALHVSTGRERVAVSNERGDFVFSSVETGEYRLSFSSSGFKKKILEGVNLTTGETLPLGDTTLEIGATNESVSVTAQAAVVETRSAERANLISSEQIENLLVRGRNFTDLLQLIPGVVQTTKTQDLSSTTNFYVMGNRATSNNITIDGVPATDMGNGTQLKLNVSQDAVSEVKVLTSNYQAEYGRMAGSNVVVVTKSGGRNFHGLVSYFKRHEQFNANDFFNNLNGLPVNRYRYNTWTYNINGPVTIPGLFNRNRDKLFFYWGQEFWPTVTGSTGSVTMPTALERTGDFSQSIDQSGKAIVVRDPFNNNTPFPGNKIPANRLDPSGLSLLSLFPAPNFTNRAISGGNYNYVFSSQTEVPKRTNTGKLDYILNSNNTITGSFNTFSDDRTGGIGLPDSGAINWPLMTKHYFTHPKSTSARWTLIVNPSTINELTFGFLDQPARDDYRDSELNKIKRSAVVFGAGQFSPSANPLGVIPNATFGGISGAANLIVEGRFPLYNDYNIYNWTDNATLTRGSHTVKAGLYVERFVRNQKKAVVFNGAFDFGTNANNPLNTGYAYANAALGAFNSYTESTGLGWMNVQSWDYEAFVQDNWKISRRLTLDFGLRLYWVPPMTERDNLISAFIPSQYDPKQAVKLIRPAIVNGQRVGMDPIAGITYAAAQIGAIAPGSGNPANGAVRAGANGIRDSIIGNPGTQWGPRAGFAYDVFGDGKMAVRGGFGIFYNRFFTETYFTNLVAAPPLVATPIVTYGQLSTLRSSTGLLYPTNVYAPDLSGKLPTVMNYSLSVQRDIGFQTVLDVAYAASLGRHLVWLRDTNAIAVRANFAAANADPTSPGKPLPASFLRPVQGYNSILAMEGGSSSNYHSLQVSAQRRLVKHFQFGAAWTWSKAMDFNDTDTETVTTVVPLRAWNYGFAGFDRTHVLSINYMLELPGTPWKNFAARTLLNGWQLSGITSYSSGAPLAVAATTTNGADITGTPSITQRPDLTGDPRLSNDKRTFSRAFDTSVFRLPAVGAYGNAGRWVLRGPGAANWDMAIAKDFRIHETVRLNFRAEAYNAFNHTQFSAIDTTARFDPVAGSQTNPRFGAYTAARDPRQMQFALRLRF